MESKKSFGVPGTGIWIGVILGALLWLLLLTPMLAQIDSAVVEKTDTLYMMPRGYNGLTYCNSNDIPETILAAHIFESPDKLLAMEVLAHEKMHRDRVMADGGCREVWQKLTQDPRLRLDHEAQAYCAGIKAVAPFEDEERRLYRLNRILFFLHQFFGSLGISYSEIPVALSTYGCT